MKKYSRKFMNSSPLSCQSINEKENVFQEHYSSKYRHKMSGSHEDCSLIRRLIHKLAEFLTFSIANKKKLSPDTTWKGRERRMGHLLALLAVLSR